VGMVVPLESHPHNDDAMCIIGFDTKIQGIVQ
jgi:hypothetical protein